MGGNIIPMGFFGKVKLFFFPIFENKLQTILTILYFFINASFGISFLFFIQYAIDALESNSQQALPQVIYNFSLIFIVILFLFFLFGKLGWPYSFNRFRESIEKRFLPFYIQFDPSFQEKMGTGKTISILSKGILTWGTLLDRFFQEITLFCVSIGVTLYFISQVNSNLVFLFLFLLIFAQGLGVFLNSFTIKIRKGRVELNNLWSREMVRIIMSKMEVLQSSKIDQEVQKLHNIHEKQIGFNLKMAPYLNAFFSIGHVFTFCMMMFVFYYIGNQYFQGRISLGVASSTLGALLMMQRVFLSTLDFLKNFTKEFSEVEVMWDFFQDAPVLEGYEGGDIFEYKKGEINIQNLTYSYEGNTNVFEDFDLKLAGGNITAFVGPSGGGKSTLVKLIAGYLKANTGEVVVDGHKLSETSLKTYYQDVGYLTQEPSVFNGTVRENLLYALGDESVDEKKIQNIISLARCEFIYDLPQGLDSEIGERGVRLSGGQKQRLAIAKIFLKNPQIIILDEPTSALDSQSEKYITEAMRELFKNRSVLVIAHRLQTVKHADEIIVIDAGKIIERGNHKKLLAQKGYYAEMLELQSGF